MKFKGDEGDKLTMSSTSSTTLMDEFQAFVTRVKQLHMSRSADTDCEQNLNHDKGRRRYESAVVADCVDGEPLKALSLDDQQLERRRASLDTSLEDIDMQESGGRGVEKEEKEGEDKKRLKKNATKGEMKKNIQVMVGIDEDLKMILEMDPEIVDLGGLEKPTAEPKVMGLPPLSGR